MDPETGDIITSRKKPNRVTNAEKDEDDTYNLIITQLQKELLEKDSKINTLQMELKILTAKYAKAEKLIEKITLLTTVFMCYSANYMNNAIKLSIFIGVSSREHRYFYFKKT